MQREQSICKENNLYAKRTVYVCLLPGQRFEGRRPENRWPGNKQLIERLFYHRPTISDHAQLSTTFGFWDNFVWPERQFWLADKQSRASTLWAHTLLSLDHKFITRTPRDYDLTIARSLSQQVDMNSVITLGPSYYLGTLMSKLSAYQTQYCLVRQRERARREKERERERERERLRAGGERESVCVWKTELVSGKRS